MLLDDESSINNEPEFIQEPPKIFSNPYFKKPPVKSSVGQPFMKKASSPSIWDSEDRGNGRRGEISSVVNLSSKPVLSVSYSNSLTDHVPDYMACYECSMAFDKQKGHVCDQGQVDSIPSAELDSLLAAFDRRIIDLYCKLHTFAAAYLHKLKPDICEIVRKKALTPAVDLIGSNDPIVFEDCFSLLESCAEEIEVSFTQSSLRDSTTVLLKSLADMAGEKLAILSVLPPSTLAMVSKLQTVELDADMLTNQLAIWRQRCSLLGTPKSAAFDMGSFLCRIVDLKSMLGRDNPNRYVFAVEECEEVAKKRLDYQSALDLIADRYFGC